MSLLSGEERVGSRSETSDISDVTVPLSRALAARPSHRPAGLERSAPGALCLCANALECELEDMRRMISGVGMHLRKCASGEIELHH